MWLAAIACCLMAILILSVSWTDVRGAPWVPTSMRMVRRMLTLAEVGPDDVVYDLGCGDGRMIITAARRYGARAVGIEIDPLRYLWCQMLITILRLRKRIRIIYGDFFGADLREADVVTCYLLQSTNDRLEEKLRTELRSGARVVSNTFTFDGLDAVRSEKGAWLYRCSGNEAAS